MAQQSKQRNHIAEAWLVILLALGYGGALAGVHTALTDRINLNKQNETYSVIPSLIEGADAGKTEALTVSDARGTERRIYKAHAADGTHVGWVLPGQGQGFADRIELIVGVDPAVETITGIYVLNQKETPGLGDYITGEDFRGRYAGAPTDEPLEVVKGDAERPNEIRALTGATISSVAVSDIVNQTVRELRPAITER